METAWWSHEKKSRWRGRWWGQCLEASVILEISADAGRSWWKPQIDWPFMVSVSSKCQLCSFHCTYSSDSLTHIRGENDRARLILAGGCDRLSFCHHKLPVLVFIRSLSRHLSKIEYKVTEPLGRWFQMYWSLVYTSSSQFGWSNPPARQRCWWPRKGGSIAAAVQGAWAQRSLPSWMRLDAGKEKGWNVMELAASPGNFVSQTLQPLFNHYST